MADSKWEYLVDSDLVAAVLNLLGSEGWELVAVVSEPGCGDGIQRWFYFKRPLA